MTDKNPEFHSADTSVAIIEAKKALGVSDSEDPSEQLSLLSENSVELNPEAVPYKRAVLGSRALKGALRTGISRGDEISVEQIGDDDGTGRSIGAKRRQTELDKAEARSQMRQGLNARGWGRGQGR